MSLSRTARYLIVAFAGAFLVITAMKARRDTKPESGVRMSAAQKTRIAQFWERYRYATDRRHAGDLEEAVVAYRDALRFNDRHEDALYYLGNMLFALGRYDEAMEAFRRLIEINPLSTRAHFQMGAILSSMTPDAPFDLDGAEREFRRTFAINREESEPPVRLGEVALAKGAYDRAEAYFKDATRLNAKAVEAYFLLGYIRWRRGDRPQALALFRTALARRREAPAPDGKRQHLFTQAVQAAMTGPPQRTDGQIDAAYRKLARFCERVNARWRMQPR